MSISSSRVSRLGGSATMLGGLAWLLAWVHFLLTHGPTTSDYEKTLLGMSYYDSTKLTVIASALCIFGLVRLGTRRPKGLQATAGTWGQFIAVAAMTAMAVGMAINVWNVPWGDTTRVGTDLMDYAFIVMMIATLFALAGLTLVGIGAGRSNVLPSWSIVPLAVAGIGAVPFIHHTPYGLFIGLGWIAFGYGLWRSNPAG
jgi:hypothetical protein